MSKNKINDIINESNFRELGNIKRSPTKKEATFQKIKSSSYKVKTPKRNYIAIFAAVFIIIILISHTIQNQEHAQSNDFLEWVELTVTNLIGTGSFNPNQMDEETVEKINDIFSKGSSEISFPFNDHFKPSEYVFFDKNDNKKTYEVWINVSRSENGNLYEGVFREKGTEYYYQLEQEDVQTLLKNTFIFDVTNVENNERTLREFNNLDFQQNNKTLEDPNFMKNLQSGIVNGLQIPANTSAQVIINNYKGPPDFILDAGEGGASTLFYLDCLCGVQIGNDYQNNIAVEGYNYYIPIEMNRQSIISILGEPDAEEESQTSTSYEMYYYNKENQQIMFYFRKTDQDSDYFDSLIVPLK